MRLTDMRVQSLKPDPTRHKVYYDDTPKGFGVRVAKGGTKAFILATGKNRAGMGFRIHRQQGAAPGPLQLR
jgi:hypothetical protein